MPEEPTEPTAPEVEPEPFPFGENLEVVTNTTAGTSVLYYSSDAAPPTAAADPAGISPSLLADGYPVVAMRVGYNTLRLWLDYRGNLTLQAAIEASCGVRIPDEIKHKPPLEVVKWLSDEIARRPVPEEAPTRTERSINIDVTSRRNVSGRCYYREPEIGRESLTITEGELQELMQECIDSDDDFYEALDRWVNDQTGNMEFDYENDGEIDYSDHEMSDTDDYETNWSSSQLHQRASELARLIDPDGADQLGI